MRFLCECVCDASARSMFRLVVDNNKEMKLFRLLFYALRFHSAALSSEGWPTVVAFAFFGLFIFSVHFGKWCYWWNFVCARFPLASHLRARLQFMIGNFLYARSWRRVVRLKNKLPSNRTAAVKVSGHIANIKSKWSSPLLLVLDVYVFASHWQWCLSTHCIRRHSSTSDIAELVVFASANVPWAHVPMCIINDNNKTGEMESRNVFRISLFDRAIRRAINEK